MLASFLVFKYIFEKIENKKVKMAMEINLFFALEIIQPNISMMSTRKSWGGEKTQLHFTWNTVCGWIPLGRNIILLYWYYIVQLE